MDILKEARHAFLYEKPNVFVPVVHERYRRILYFSVMRSPSRYDSVISHGVHMHKMWRQRPETLFTKYSFNYSRIKHIIELNLLDQARSIWFGDDDDIDF